MDRIVAPYDDVEATQIAQVVGKMEVGEELRLRILGQDSVGNPREFTAILPIVDGANGEERLKAAGLVTAERDGKVVVDNVDFGSVAQKAGLDWDQVVLLVRAPANQPWKELMYIPALLLLGLIYVMQRKRREKSEAADANV